jgi:hypothetical protein
MRSVEPTSNLKSERLVQWLKQNLATVLTDEGMEID